MKKELKIFYSIIFLVFSIFIASRALSDVDAGSHVLNASMTFISCQTDFAVGVGNSFLTNIPNGTYSNAISTNITALESDRTQLQSYASSGNVSAFRTYVFYNYSTDLIKLTFSFFKDAIGQKPSVLNRIRTDYSSLKITYENCSFSALRTAALLKVDAYNQIIDNYQQKINNISTKINDTSSLTQILADANSTIIQPLQSAINTANDSQSLRNAFRSYCLFNGCVNGTNFHLAAKFNLARLQLILNYIKATPPYSNQTDKISQAQNYLDAASSALVVTGASTYAGNESQEVWSNEIAAGNVMKTILSSTTRSIY